MQNFSVQPSAARSVEHHRDVVVVHPVTDELRAHDVHLVLDVLLVAPGRDALRHLLPLVALALRRFGLRLEPLDEISHAVAPPVSWLRS